MDLPAVEQPQRYAGLYVFDFGEWTAVGYTADEVSLLLESEHYRDGRVYKIVRATPDGRFELKGVARERFEMESGLFFWRAELDAARGDFDTLRDLARQRPPPCRAFLHLVDRGSPSEAARYVTALVYPAEHEDEVSTWLRTSGYAGGDLVEGGISRVTNYYSDPKTILDRQQLWSRPAASSRSADEVLASVRRAVQR